MTLASKATVRAMDDVFDELAEATENNGAFNSAHEGYAVILEELDELWEEVRKKTSERDPEKMRKEAMQVAAMAIRFMTDICDPVPEGELLPVEEIERPDTFYAPGHPEPQYASDHHAAAAAKKEAA